MIRVQEFIGGMNTKFFPTLLQNNQAVLNLNADITHGVLSSILIEKDSTETISSLDTSNNNVPFTLNAMLKKYIWNFETEDIEDYDFRYFENTYQDKLLGSFNKRQYIFYNNCWYCIDKDYKHNGNWYLACYAVDTKNPNKLIKRYLRIIQPTLDWIDKYTVSNRYPTVSGSRTNKTYAQIFADSSDSNYTVYTTEYLSTEPNIAGISNIRIIPAHNNQDLHRKVCINPYTFDTSYGFVTTNFSEFEATRVAFLSAEVDNSGYLDITKVFFLQEYPNIPSNEFSVVLFTQPAPNGSHIFDMAFTIPLEDGSNLSYTTVYAPFFRYGHSINPENNNYFNFDIYLIPYQSTKPYITEPDRANKAYPVYGHFMKSVQINPHYLRFSYKNVLNQQYTTQTRNKEYSFIPISVKNVLNQQYTTQTRNKEYSFIPISVDDIKTAWNRPISILRNSLFKRTTSLTTSIKTSYNPSNTVAKKISVLYEGDTNANVLQKKDITNFHTSESWQTDKNFPLELMTPADKGNKPDSIYYGYTFVNSQGHESNITVRPKNYTAKQITHSRIFVSVYFSLLYKHNYDIGTKKPVPLQVKAHEDFETVYDQYIDIQGFRVYRFNKQEESPTGILVFSRTFTLDDKRKFPRKQYNFFDVIEKSTENVKVYDTSVRTNPPENLEYLGLYANRLLASQKNILYYSESRYVHIFPQKNKITLDSDITGFATLTQHVMIFTKTSIYVMYLTDVLPTITKITDKIGCDEPYSIQVILDKPYWVYKSHIWSIVNGYVTKVTQNLINNLEYIHTSIKNNKTPRDFPDTAENYVLDPHNIDTSDKKMQELLSLLDKNKNELDPKQKELVQRIQNFLTTDYLYTKRKNFFGTELSGISFISDNIYFIQYDNLICAYNPVTNSIYYFDVFQHLGKIQKLQEIGNILNCVPLRNKILFILTDIANQFYLKPLQIEAYMLNVELSRESVENSIYLEANIPNVLKTSYCYISPMFSEGDSTVLKQYNKITIHFWGYFFIEIKIDNRPVYFPLSNTDSQFGKTPSKLHETDFPSWVWCYWYAQKKIHSIDYSFSGNGTEQYKKEQIIPKQTELLKFIMNATKELYTKQPRVISDTYSIPTAITQTIQIPRIFQKGRTIQVHIMGKGSLLGYTIDSEVAPDGRTT